MQYSIRALDMQPFPSTLVLIMYGGDLFYDENVRLSIKN